MKDEIVNEAINALKEYIKEVKDQTAKCKDGFIVYPIELSYKHVCFLLNYITNLQEELEDLRESDWAWHQTLKAQNKREYRSKFLKEFQQEYNTNTFPDYDEIYKRYDKLKEENKKLKEKVNKFNIDKINNENKSLKGSCKVLGEKDNNQRKELNRLIQENEEIKVENEKLTQLWLNSQEKRRKAIEYNKKNIKSRTLNSILQGSDKDE